MSAVKYVVYDVRTLEIIKTSEWFGKDIRGLLKSNPNYKCVNTTATPIAYLPIKHRTLLPQNIIKASDGRYRYVNHKEELLTTGFGTEALLLKYTDDIRFYDEGIELMKKSYKKLIIKGEVQK